MEAAFLVAALVSLLAALVLKAGFEWLMQQQERPRDPELRIDQWTQERRQRLAHLQGPAPKGTEAHRARRHTVVGFKREAR